MDTISRGQRVRRALRWKELALEEKRTLLKKELLEEMITCATKLGLHLAVDQIIGAIDQTEYNAEELDAQHAAYLDWRLARPQATATH